MRIYPAKSLHGTVHLPGDKSISHRAALIAAMAVGDTRIENFSTAEDCQTTIKCLKELGVSITQIGNDVLVKGVGKNGFRKPIGPLDCGNSGTTLRLLAGILAGQDFETTLIGDESLKKRPMQRVIDPLEKMGARIGSSDDKPPLTISGIYPLRSFAHVQNIASAQVKSSILLAALNSDGDTSIIETIWTRDHTERMLEWFDVNVRTSMRKDRKQVTVSGSEVLKAHDVKIPSDISSAAFFIVAAACLRGSNIEMTNVGVNRTRTAICDLIFDLCADAEIHTFTDVCNERVGTINVYGGLLPRKQRLLLNGPIIAQMIDELPIIAILGTQLEHGIEVRDAGELRVKESDRIVAITENLKRMGAEVTEFDDGFKVEKSRLKGAVVDSFGDHRIAMAFAVAGILADGETEIIDAHCVDVSFPGFFDVLASITRST
ncbi:MAG: 3-phosphoshikimate 1-carboxyvinyltransferase [Chloracidobacterium sp.]|nr:3-phosphoshikimate 1-carboxyvinyltransferase [Chloracidobacterium sp.]